MEEKRKKLFPDFNEKNFVIKLKNIEINIF